jgi:hypothetical protein
MFEYLLTALLPSPTLKHFHSHWPEGKAAVSTIVPSLKLMRYTSVQSEFNVSNLDTSLDFIFIF